MFDRCLNRRRLIMAASLVLISLLVAAHAMAAPPPLIPRTLLFGNPEKAEPRLSPDGTRLLYLAPDKGVLNVWVKTLGRDDDRVVTADTLRGIRIALWAEDDRHILYMQDKGGDENWRIYSVDLTDGAIRDLTPYENVQARLSGTHPDFPDQLLVEMNRRDPRVMDLYKIALSTGETKLVAENPGDIAGYFPDTRFLIRGAVASTADGGFTLLARDSEADTFHTILTWGPDEQGSPVGFTPDGKGMYISDSRGANVSRLMALDLATASTTLLAEDPKVDMGDVMIHPTKYHVEAASFNYDRNRWRVLDTAIAADFAVLEKVVDGEFSIVSRDRADRHWIVLFMTDDHPARFYTYDRDTKTATFLFTTRPDLEEYELTPMQFVEIPSRDGMLLPAYLTLPPGVEAKNLPFVLNVHGGPWARDDWGYDGEAQWMANRGWAVLQVNFRGSTGFGKNFVNAGNREWGRNMQNDLTDAVEWAIKQGYADPKKVAIYGGSYGGYATLAGVAFTPDLYICGVDLFGPSNIMTLLASIPPYWSTVVNLFHHRVGDPATEEAMLKERSPLFSADKIKVPLLIAQGANDPRVKPAESEQIVGALKARGQDVEYVVYPDEGHGFARPENRLDFYGRSERFLHRYLGGRIEE